jgi:hypothetical protein
MGTFEEDREQLALFFHARDVQTFGTAPWGEIDPIGREQYLQDAEAAMRALQALGWRAGEVAAKAWDEGWRTGGRYSDLMEVESPAAAEPFGIESNPYLRPEDAR